MPTYEFFCKGKCKRIVEIIKRMIEPDPIVCPHCKSKKFERVYGVPNIGDGNKPIWTYKECLKYKTMRWKDGPLLKVDPSKHGDSGAQYCDLEKAPEPKKKKKKPK